MTRQASAPSPVQPNRFPGPCETCGTYVPARAGVCVRYNGRWTVRCADHSSGATPRAAAPAAAPAVSREAAQAAMMLVRSAERDENHAASAVAWEILAAVFFCGGQPDAADAAAGCMAAANAARAKADAARTETGAGDLVGEILDRVGDGIADAPAPAKGPALRIVYRNGNPVEHPYHAIRVAEPGGLPHMSGPAPASTLAKLRGAKLAPPRPDELAPAPAPSPAPARAPASRKRDRWAHRKPATGTK